jgi:TRAP-type C4-dicarboxylate transport system substrate-binding protein
LNLFFPPPTPSQGDLLPVYRRADLSRTITLVVALFLTAASTSAFAREFRAADTQNEDYPTVQALLYMGGRVAERSGGRHQIKVFHARQLGEEKETLERSHKQAEAAGVKIVTDVDRKPIVAAMAGLYAKAQRDPAVAQLIERIRKVK